MCCVDVDHCGLSLPSRSLCALVATEGAAAAALSPLLLFRPLASFPHLVGVRGMLLEVVLLQLRQLVKVRAAAHCALERRLRAERRKRGGQR